MVALAIQFALSFGHIHVDGFVQAPGLLSSFIGSGQNLSPDPADAPTDPLKHIGYGHYCAICAGIHSAGVLPAPTPLLGPLVIVSDELTIGRIRTKLTASLSVLFQARAPPFA